MNAGITRITPDPLLLSMKKLICRIKIMHIRCCGFYAVNQAVPVINANMHLHAKVPFIAFLGLVHFRVSLTFLVLGRAGCGDNRGINNGAFSHHQALLSQLGAYGIEDHLAQFVTLKQMTEAENGAVIWQPVGQPQSGKAAHGLDLVQRILHRRIAEVVEQLQAVHPKHNGERVRRVSILTLGVVLAKLLLQLGSGNQTIHFFQEQLPPRFTLFVLVFGFGESQLAHAIFHLKGVTAKLHQIAGVVQTFLQ